MPFFLLKKFWAVCKPNTAKTKLGFDVSIDENRRFLCMGKFSNCF